MTRRGTEREVEELLRALAPQVLAGPAQPPGRRPAHLLELAGDPAAARDHYRAAARRTTGLPEQRYLEERAARLEPDLR